MISIWCGYYTNIENINSDGQERERDVLMYRRVFRDVYAISCPLYTCVFCWFRLIANCVSSCVCVCVWIRFIKLLYARHSRHRPDKHWRLLLRLLIFCSTIRLLCFFNIKDKGYDDDVVWVISFFVVGIVVDLVSMWFFSVERFGSS